MDKTTETKSLIRMEITWETGMVDMETTSERTYEMYTVKFHDETVGDGTSEGFKTLDEAKAYAAEILQRPLRKVGMGNLLDQR